MSYIEESLSTGEEIQALFILHWVAKLPMILWIVLIITIPLALWEWLKLHFTEMGVTNKRVIFKTGFVRRRTVEMNMDKVETVDVDQSILGRILGYGTIHVLGTGSGIEHLRQVAHPLELRSAITAK